MYAWHEVPSACVAQLAVLRIRRNDCHFRVAARRHLEHSRFLRLHIEEYHLCAHTSCVLLQYLLRVLLLCDYLLVRLVRLFDLQRHHSFDDDLVVELLPFPVAALPVEVDVVIVDLPEVLVTRVSASVWIQRSTEGRLARNGRTLLSPGALRVVGPRGLLRQLLLERSGAFCNLGRGKITEQILLGDQLAWVEAPQCLLNAFLIRILHVLELNCMLLTDPPRLAEILAEVRLNGAGRSVAP